MPPFEKIEKEQPPVPLVMDGLLRAIVESWDGLLYVGGPDFRIRYMNRRFIEALGRDATGENCFRALHGRDDVCPWCPQEAFHGKTVQGLFQKPTDGRWFDVLNIPLPLPDGQFAKIAMIREADDKDPAIRSLPVFRNLVDHLSDAVVFHDPAEGRILYGNDQACRQLGCSREEMTGRYPWEFSAQPDSPENWQKMLARIEARGFDLFETRCRHRDGSIRDVEVKATRIQAGLQNLVVAIARDISERKRTEGRLIEERNKAEAIMSATGDGITVQDRDYRIIYQNEVVVRRFGWRLGEHCYRVYAGKDEVCAGCQVQKTFADGRTYRRQIELALPGGVTHQEITACPLRNAAGEVVACVEVTRDITEQKRMEQELTESNEKYRLLFSAESDAILTFNSDSGEIQEVNDTACALYALTRRELLGKNWRDLEAGAPEEKSRKLASGMHFRGDGSLFPVEVSLGDYRWRGRPMTVAVVRDISDRRRLEQAREEAFSLVSHEIRTPLTSILGFAQFLHENPTNPEQQREFLGLILQEGERLRRQIDNLLSLQRLRAGFGLENPGPVPLFPLLHDVAGPFRHPLVGQQIEIACTPELPPVLGEGNRLREAVGNLLGNAVKYSPAGSRIVMGARREGDRALIWVRDQGPGIPAGMEEKIFERFVRLEGGEGPSGTGLGLALVREIAEAHQGQTWVESTQGMGSTFFLSLPLAPRN